MHASLNKKDFAGDVSTDVVGKFPRNPDDFVGDSFSVSIELHRPC